MNTPKSGSESCSVSRRERCRRPPRRRDGGRRVTTAPPVLGLIAGNGMSSSAATFRVRGVAPDTRIVNLRALGRDGRGTDSSVIAAIERAIALKQRFNIRIINLSLGRPVYRSYTTGNIPGAAAVAPGLAVRRARVERERSYRQPASCGAATGLSRGPDLRVDFVRRRFSLHPGHRPYARTRRRSPSVSSTSCSSTPQRWRTVRRPRSVPHLHA